MGIKWKGEKMFKGPWALKTLILSAQGEVGSQCTENKKKESG